MKIFTENECLNAEAAGNVVTQPPVVIEPPVDELPF